jgi:16S rRNA G966 N2-methylase RsmD
MAKEESIGLGDFGLGGPTEEIEEPEVIEEKEEVEPEEQPEEDPEGSVEETPEDEPSEEEPQVPTIKIDGVDVPVSNLTQDQITKLQTHYGQVANYQKRYEERDSQVQELQEKLTTIMAGMAAQQQQQQQPQQPEPEPMTPQSLVNKYRGRMDEAAEKGWISQLLVEEDPAAVATMMHNMEVANAAHQRSVMLEQQLNNVVQHLQASSDQYTQESARTAVYSAAEELAGEHPVFAPLKDPEQRDRFFRELELVYQNDPEASARIVRGLMENPKENLRKLYLGPGGQMALEMATKASQAAEQRKKQVRSRVSGEGGGSAPAKPRKTEDAPDPYGLSDFGRPTD